MKVENTQIFGGKGIYIDKSNCTFFGMEEEGKCVYLDRKTKTWYDQDDNELEVDIKVTEAICMFGELMSRQIT